VRTPAELAEQLAALGLGAGDTVLVHSSLRALGPVAGGAAGLAEAVLAVVGAEGTLVVPAFSQANSRTSRVYRQRTEGLSPEQIRAFEDAMPAFDPALTPADTGAFAEFVRHLPGAVRSGHPQTSYAAIGARAREITDGHAACHHGEGSPLGRLYDADARTLLLGVGYEACSAFHLGEYRLPDPPRRVYECVVAAGEGKRWHAYESEVLDDGDFPDLGRALDADAAAMVRHGHVGAADCRLVPIAPAVDFAVAWFLEHRRGNDPGRGPGERRRTR
jgi:aminoglycoside 3-N-acetyltransferase